MPRPAGPSVRLKLTLSYAGFLMLAGALLLAAVGVFLVRQGWLLTNERGAVRATPGTVFLRSFAPTAVAVMAFLLVFGLLGGWFLAGRMLAPLDRITHATRTAQTGSLSHRIRMPGRRDEFRELADAFDTMLDRLEAHVAAQQRFAANASHELRTPLAVSRTLLDVARTDPNRTPARSSSACTPSTPGRSTSPSPCSCSAARDSAPSPGNTSTCPSSRRRPPRPCSPLRSGTASPSKPPVT
ncbi:hypothetical protein STENM223S_09226 [Streptomyces tendae]